MLNFLKVITLYSNNFICTVSYIYIYTHTHAHTYIYMQLLLLLLSRFSRVQLCATPQTAAYYAPPIYTRIYVCVCVCVCIIKFDIGITLKVSNTFTLLSYNFNFSKYLCELFLLDTQNNMRGNKARYNFTGCNELNTKMKQTSTTWFDHSPNLCQKSPSGTRFHVSLGFFLQNS